MHMYDLFHAVLKFWMWNDEVIKIEFYKDMLGIEAMEVTVRNVANGTRNGIILIIHYPLCDLIPLTTFVYLLFLTM